MLKIIVEITEKNLKYCYLKLKKVQNYIVPP